MTEERNCKQCAIEADCNEIQGALYGTLSWHYWFEDIEEIVEE